MSKIFILSNTYTIRNIILSIRYLFNEGVDSIVILEENCELSDFPSECADINLIVCSSLDDCINICDVVVIPNEKCIPSKTLKYVIEKSTKLNKKYYTDCYVTQIPVLDCNNKSFKTKPIILMLTLGNYTQHMYIELVLNKIFAGMHVPIKQILSYETYHLLKTINMSGLMNLNLDVFFVEELDTDYQMIVWPVCLESLEELEGKLDDFKKLSPDFIICSAEFAFNDIDFLKNTMFFNCSSTIDLIIKSHYHRIDRIYTVYCRKKIDCLNEIVDLESPDLEYVIKEKIINKLSFPIGIMPI